MFLLSRLFSDAHSQAMTARAVIVLVLALVSCSIPGEGTLIFQNRCSSSIRVSTVDSGNYTIGPNGSSPPINPESGSSITFWGCRSDQMDCIISDNPIATVGIIGIGSDINNYSLSVENGYNLPIRMMPLGSGNCPIISCSASMGQCPDQLKTTGAKNLVAACKAPTSCLEPGELCSSFSSMIAKDSQCRIPGSNYSPSSIIPTCPSSVDLLVIFSC